jgi:hypothetical protein
MFGLLLGPDGPPLDQRDSVRYTDRAVDGISAGYAGFYEQEQHKSDIQVFGLTFDRLSIDLKSSVHDSPSTGRKISWFEFGSTLVVVMGPAGDCLDVIQAHIGSMAGRR